MNNEHKCNWVKLDDQFIDITRQRADYPNVKSVYRIVEVCDGHDGCCAGQTGDGIVFKNVMQGRELEADGIVVRTTGPLQPRRSK